MPRSNDGKLRSGLNWLMASLVMAAPLAWVGSHALEEPLYVAGSMHDATPAAQLASYLPEHAGPTAHAPLLNAAIHARSSRDIRRIEALGHPLAMMQ